MTSARPLARSLADRLARRLGYAPRAELRAARRAAEEARAVVEQTRRRADAARSTADEAVEAQQRLRHELDESLRSAASYRRECRSTAAAYRRLVGSIEDVSPEDVAPLRDGWPDRDAERSALARARGLVGRARLTDSLTTGARLDEAVVSVVRVLLDRQDHVAARALGQSLLTSRETARAGRLAEAVAAARYGLDELAWSRFAEAGLEAVARVAPGEFALVAARTDPDVIDAVASLVLDADRLDVAGAVDTLRAAVVARRPAAADRLYGVLSTAPSVGPAQAKDVTWLGPWVDRLLEPPEAPAVEAGEVPFGVLGFRSADRTRSTSDLGDYVQTVAALSHLVRRRGVSLTGPADLVDVTHDLTARVRPGAVVDGPPRRVRLVEVNRDASSWDPVPEGTWTLTFGWFMQSVFDAATDFPMNPNLNPVFVAFHVNRPEMLTPAALDYLRRHGPVGCRDWSTVYLLLSLGVPAFFSGCLTTTVDALFDARPEVDGDLPAAYVGVPAPPGAPTLVQSHDGVRDATLPENLGAAVRLLESYRRHGRLVTSRLHCYLPARTMGCDVELRPQLAGDVRFPGLVGTSAEELAAMSERITGLVRTVLDEILAGSPRDDVYEAWRAACEVHVQAARARFAADVRVPPSPVQVDEVVADVRARARRRPAGERRDGSTVHVVVALDGNLKEHLPTVLSGVADRTTRPVEVHVLCRDHDDDDMATTERLFPELAFEWLPCDAVDHGEVPGMLSHTTMSTLDRLLLPDLLPGVGRVIYHDMDALALADLGPLYDVELDGAPLAARDDVGRYATSSVRAAWVAARRLPDVATVDVYLRAALRQLDGDARAFNAGVMVLDLDRMRTDRFSERFLPWVAAFGLNDQQLLNCYAGARRAPLDRAWNAFPGHELLPDRPRIVHFAGHRKPWEPAYVLLREEWERAGDRAAGRARRVHEAR